MYECHHAPTSEHRDRENNYLTNRRDVYWPRHSPFVRKYIQDCGGCQRVKRGPSYCSPLQHLPDPAEFWGSVSKHFVSAFPKKIAEILAFFVLVYRLSKMVHLVAVSESITVERSARDSSKRSFKSNDYYVNSCPVETRVVWAIFGSPCSSPFEHVWRCQLLTIR